MNVISFRSTCISERTVCSTISIQKISYRHYLYGSHGFSSSLCQIEKKSFSKTKNINEKILKTRQNLTVLQKKEERKQNACCIYFSF